MRLVPTSGLLAEAVAARGAGSFAAIDLAAAVKLLGRELGAGVTLAVVALPSAIPTGLLVYSQLGGRFFAEGVLSGIYGLIFAGVKALRTAPGARSRGEPIAVEELDLVKAVEGEERALLISMLRPRTFASGAMMCKEGEEADRLWIIAEGSVSVRLRGIAGGDFVRIASMGPGTSVGEMSLLDGGPRSATVVCDKDVECYELSRTAFDAILRDHVPLARKLFSYFARELVQRVRLVNRDLRVLNR